MLGRQVLLDHLQPLADDRIGGRAGVTACAQFGGDGRQWAAAAGAGAVFGGEIAVDEGVQRIVAGEQPVAHFAELPGSFLQGDFHQFVL
ncbi:hypothetical protein D3C76_694650 [compost metagenome]